jgi:hypothetical protein
VRARRVANAALLPAVLLALGACSSGSTDAKDPDRSPSSTSSTSTTTVAVTPLERWVARWRGVLATEYGPAQQAFLAAVQEAQVVAVQEAATKLLAANQGLQDAVRDAGPPPAEATEGSAQLVAGLAAERTLLEEIHRVCTGEDDACQQAVTSYGDNNSEQIVPAFVALKV